MIDAELAARRAIEDAGYHVHDANVIFGANCPNIDLVVYGKSSATYVQVKGTKRAAGKDCIIVDGSPWTEEQLHGRTPVYNKHDGLVASHVVLVDLSNPDAPEFFVAMPKRLTELARKRGKKYAALPKRDGSTRSIGFRKELPKDQLRDCRSAWQSFGSPVHRAARPSIKPHASPLSRTPVRKSASRTAWNKGKTMTLHACKVGGKTYPSVWAAFQELYPELPRGVHTHFRRELKQTKGGRLEFRREGVKPATFVLVKAQPGAHRTGKQAPG
jgi:hypothetical protein